MNVIGTCTGNGEGELFHLRAHCRITALSAYLAVILDDTAQNIPGALDLCDAEGVLADLASDLTGTIQRAADSMAGWLA